MNFDSNSFLKSLGTGLDVSGLAKTYSLSEGEIEELIIAFNAIDKDGSGSFDADEISAVLRCVRRAHT